MVSTVGAWLHGNPTRRRQSILANNHSSPGCIQHHRRPTSGNQQYRLFPDRHAVSGGCAVRTMRGSWAEMAAAMCLREPEARVSSIMARSVGAVPAGRLFCCYVEYEGAGQKVGVCQNYWHNVTCFQRRRCRAGQRHHT